VSQSDCVMYTNPKISPADFMPFDDMPHVVAFAISTREEVLWSNHAFTVLAGNKPAANAGLTGFFSSAVTKQLEAILNTNADAMHGFVQVVRGRRSYVRTWPLDPGAFGKPGLFVLIEPAILRPADEHAFPLVPAADLGEFESLSRRELEVLWYTAAGFSASETAQKLSRSVRTVENHIASVHNKLGVSRRAELTRFAVERGILAFSSEEWTRIIQHAA